MTSYHINHRFFHLPVAKFVVAEMVSFVKESCGCCVCDDIVGGVAVPDC